MMEPKAKPAATVRLNGRTYIRHADVGAWWEMCPWAASGTRVVASGDLRECLDAFAERDADLRKLRAEGERLRKVEAAATALNNHFPPSGVTYISAAVDADIKRLRAALEAAQGGG